MGFKKYGIPSRLEIKKNLHLLRFQVRGKMPVNKIAKKL
jgi:hypothetical protein